MVEYAKTRCARLASKMKTTGTKLLITLIIVLIAAPIMSVACEEGEEVVPLPTPPPPTELSSTLVPNVPLDVYVYARQDSPTEIPAEMINVPDDIAVESWALWGYFPIDTPFDDSAVGMGLTLTSASNASNLYARISLKEDGWKRLSGNTIYLVHGSGTAAESLKTAISNNDFKCYDDSEALDAVAALPSHGTTKPAAIAIAKPSEALIGFIAKDADPEDLGRINMILKLVNLKVIAVGLYSPHHIDIAEIAETMESDGSIFDLNLGLLLLVKSGYPGFLVEPAVKKFLTESKFTETSLGEFTIYKGAWDTESGTVPVLVRIEGNRIFAAVAGQESYAETLITSINR